MCNIVHHINESLEGMTEFRNNNIIIIIATHENFAFLRLVKGGVFFEAFQMKLESKVH